MVVLPASLLALVVSQVVAEDGVPVRLVPLPQVGPSAQMLQPRLSYVPSPMSQDLDNEVSIDRDGTAHHSPVSHYSGDHGDRGIREAIHRLDSQFLYLLSRVTSGWFTLSC